MRTKLIILLVGLILISCKETNEKKAPQIIEQASQEIKFNDIDINIKLTDSIKIDRLSYRNLENEPNNLEIRVSFDNKSVEALKLKKDVSVFILLYPLNESDIQLLPKERIQHKFDNWSFYNLQDIQNNEMTMKIKNNIYDFSKIEMGLFEMKSGKRFGNVYKLDTISLSRK